MVLLTLHDDGFLEVKSFGWKIFPHSSIAFLSNQKFYIIGFRTPSCISLLFVLCEFFQNNFKYLQLQLPNFTTIVWFKLSLELVDLKTTWAVGHSCDLVGHSFNTDKFVAVVFCLSDKSLEGPQTRSPATSFHQWGNYDTKTESFFQFSTVFFFANPLLTRDNFESFNEKQDVYWTLQYVDKSLNAHSKLHIFRS